MRPVFACISLLALAAGVGCAARQPIAVPPPTAEPGERVAPRQPGVLAPPTAEELPKVEENISVEELPEAISKVAPQYPEAARQASVDGTVMVKALVGKDGRVKDTRIAKSIPMLDAAAVAAVQQWVFKPAKSRSGPVAVWIVTPVKFTLH